MGLVITWEVCQVISKVILKGKRRLNQKNSRSTCSNVLSHKSVKRMRSRCIGNPSGCNARMGLVIAWEVCQVMSKHILNGKPRLNIKRIQEAEVRTCCRTSESNGCVRVVLGIRVRLMLEWDSRSHGRCVK
ncbi:uncharacterized protein G2W53_010034 [Senna tora]|uniref:Uncharacterized protein n=1 Tax=Senna tora TaxID=362788 RepID=A0A834WYI8_9FABA|nr:uncharacterized protein G2W53_010034 [Senna tora]